MPRFRMYPLRANNVLELFQQRSLIDLDPPYQRLSVWDPEKQRRFIDSVINGVDTPKLYFHDLTQSSQTGKRYRYAVIDGKQRLLALWAFLSDDLPLPDDFVYFDDESYRAASLTYEELLSKFPVLRSRFDGFDVPVILVQAESDTFIEQLFWRLNIQMPLSAPELRNALGGPLPFVIRKIGLTPFFREAVQVRNNRLQHYDMAAKFLYITHVNAFASTKKATLDNFVRTIKRARERSEEVGSEESLSTLEGRTRFLLDQLHSFFGTSSSLLGSVGRAILYFHIFRVCSMRGVRVPFTLAMLERFNGDVAAARRKSQRMSTGSEEVFVGLENDLVRFDQEKQSFNDGGALERQYDYLRKYMVETFEVRLPERD